MLRAVSHFLDYQFILAGVKNMTDELYLRLTAGTGVRIIKDRTYEILAVSEAALVTSGTATLETALFGVPQIVCYRGDLISMLIAWMVIKVRYISLVNLIAGSEVVRELIQYSLSEKNIVRELGAILPGGEKRKKILDDYTLVREILGPQGASERVASDMVRFLNA